LLDNFGGAVAPGRKSLIVNDLRHEKKVKIVLDFRRLFCYHILSE